MESTRRYASSAFLVYEHPTRPGRFAFEIRGDWEGDVPEDQNELRMAFERTSAVLRARFQEHNPQRFRHYFDILLDLAVVAFNSPTFRLTLVARQLEQFREEVVREEGPRNKDEQQ